MNSRNYWLAAVLSGLIWGCLAVVLIRSHLYDRLPVYAVSGVIVGLCIAALSGWVYRKNTVIVFLWAPLSLIFAVALFGVLIGVSYHVLAWNDMAGWGEPILVAPVLLEWVTLHSMILLGGLIFAALVNHLAMRKCIAGVRT